MPARVWKAALGPYLEVDFLDEVSRIRAPTLLVWGDRDASATRDEQNALNVAIAGSWLVTYAGAGAGHSPHWEEPQRFAAQLVSFVAELASH